MTIQELAEQYIQDLNVIAGPEDNEYDKQSFLFGAGIAAKLIHTKQQTAENIYAFVDLEMKKKSLPQKTTQVVETNNEIARKIIGNLAANYSETRVNDIVEEMYMLTEPSVAQEIRKRTNPTGSK